MCPCEIHKGFSLNCFYFFFHNKHAPVLVEFPFNGKLRELTSDLSLEKAPNSFNCVELARVDWKSHWLETQLFHSVDSIAQMSVMIVYDQEWFATIF